MIAKIIVKIGNKSIELTIDEARELYDNLDDMFGDKNTMIPYPFIPETPYPIQPWHYYPPVPC